MENIPKKIGKALIVITIYTMFFFDPKISIPFSFALLLYIGWEYHDSRPRMGVLMLLVLFFLLPSTFYSIMAKNMNFQPGLSHYVSNAIWFIPGILLVYNKKIIRKIKS